MDKKQNPAISMIVPGLIKALMENRQLSLKKASGLLYGSLLYEKLEDENSDVWTLSFQALYEMLEKELDTGKPAFPGEAL